MSEKINALLGENERLFAKSMAIDNTRSDVRAAFEAHTKFPQLAPLLRLLETANSEGIASTKVFLPESPRGMALVFEWLHEHPSGQNRGEFVSANRNLFLLAHKLRQEQCANDIFIEGPPYDFTAQQTNQVKVPGTPTPLYSDQGQELLIK